MKPTTQTQVTTETKTRTRGTTPFDEAKRAQARLEKLEEDRAAVMAGLSEEAGVMLGALEKLRTQASIVATAEPVVAQKATAAE